MGWPATVGIAVSGDLGFFQGVDYGVDGQAFPVTVVEDEPDFVCLVGGFGAIRVREWAFGVGSVWVVGSGGVA